MWLNFVSSKSINFSNLKLTDETSDNFQPSDRLNCTSGPIILQRRGSVYGANVPMITGMTNVKNTIRMEYFLLVTHFQSTYILYVYSFCIKNL